MRRLAAMSLLAVLVAGCGSQSGLHVENGGHTIAVASAGSSGGGGHSTAPALPRRVTARIPLGGVPAIAWDGTATMWAAVWAGGPHLIGSLIAVDTATGTAGPAIVLPASNTPYLVAATGSAVYVAGAGAVMRVDPQTGKVVDRVALGGRLRALLAAQGRLWVTADGGRLVQLDPDTLGVVATRHVTGHPDAITTDGGSVLVTDDRDRTLTRMTIANGKVTGTTTIGANGAGRPSQITVYAGSIWVYEGTTVLRVATGALQLLDRVTVPGGGGSIAAGTGGVWVSGGFGVARIDPATGALDTPVAVGQAGAAIATTGDAVWLVQRPTGTLLRLVPS
jgi:hypothetical protein